MTAATGLRTMEAVTHKAWVDHMVDNGLAAPHSVTLDARGLRLWLATDDADKWGQSIHVDQVDERPGICDGYAHVTVDGRLPLLGVKVQLNFIRRTVPAVRHLEAVQG